MRQVLPILTLLTFAAVSESAAQPEMVARLGDATISHDVEAGTWLLDACGATLTLAINQTDNYGIVSLASRSRTSWTVGSSSDSTVTVNGKAIWFGDRSAGFEYQDVSVSTVNETLRLDAVFNLPTAGLRVTRHYSITSGSPSFETWTTFASLGGEAVTLSNLNGFQFVVPSGKVRWVAGLRGDSMDAVHDDAFALESRTLGADRLMLGSAARSSDQTIPWFAIDSAQGNFYAALLWSGAWSLSIEPTGTALSVSLGLAPMTTALGSQAIDSPHALFGVVEGRLAQATAALRSYVMRAVRGGRPFTPLVTYNTWFAYGANIDEQTMVREITDAAALGVELFVLDAGWYDGVGVNGMWDFESGLGSWSVDAVRFPSGLKSLSDLAHNLGMKFGIWVEPERINQSNIGRRGLQEQWLATSGGSYKSQATAQICFAPSVVRRWIVDQLSALIDAVQPDYLKWDNNFWINCSRSGHEHGADDGNFAHVNGLYQVLSQLRAKYPKLLIENVSGGGNRLDLGMLRYSDVGWMSDRSVPSVHVRHSAQGLATVFPPAYLLSFVMEDSDEPLHGARDISLYYRSRMVGALGLSFVSHSFTEGEWAEMSHEIDVYRATRATLKVASASLLSKQAAVGGPAWDVLQATSDNGAQLVIYAAQLDEGARTTIVKPTGLVSTTMYDVRSVDKGLLGSALGANLMADGIELVRSANTAAHILFITAR